MTFIENLIEGLLLPNNQYPTHISAAYMQRVWSDYYEPG